MTRIRTWAGACIVLCLTSSALAQSAHALNADPMPLQNVEQVIVPAIDMGVVAVEDAAREDAGMAPRFAIPWEVEMTPDTHGTWELLDTKTALWRLRVTSPGALSLNIGFTTYAMPRDGRLYLYASDGSYSVRPFTHADNETHGELWSPVVLSDDIVIEVVVPAATADQLRLVIGSINHGYRGFGESDFDIDRAGSCNNDVVCPISAGWEAEIGSVGVISTGGSTFCTGFMVNNTAEDGTPYFMTADHCGIGSGNASSLVVYWNFESPSCGAQCCGSLSQFNTGSFFRAGYDPSDFTLVELDDDPNPAWGVTFAGWDRRNQNATTAVAIHHPSTDEKSISFEYDTTERTGYLSTGDSPSGTHIHVIDWDDGTTEPGSSGSPLFDQNHRVIGQLHGGYAACGNDLADWYGRIYVSWTGGGSNSTRLSNWLDPIGTGAQFVDTFDPSATGMRVIGSGLVSEGPNGGPFVPASTVFTIENNLGVTLSYSVSDDANWLTLSGSGGTLPPGGTAQITASVNATAAGLSNGTYTGTITFTNLTDGDGSTTRPAELVVGVPSPQYMWDMSTNPGWSTDAGWSFGVPAGSGGVSYGNPDPSSGATGSNVYGYNLTGDYENDLDVRSLTTGAIDCTDLTQVSLRFQRWLNVETRTYDEAGIYVSNNGSTWSTVWENPSGFSNHVEDSAWTEVEYDISSVADNEATVYIRWDMGTTDGSWRFSGWNIDDVEILGLAPEEPNCPADLTDDGIVDAGDLNIILSDWGCTGSCVGDLTGDGFVDAGDLNIVLSAWGACE